MGNVNSLTLFITVKFHHQNLQETIAITMALHKIPQKHYISIKYIPNRKVEISLQNYNFLGEQKKKYVHMSLQWHIKDKVKPYLLNHFSFSLQKNTISCLPKQMK